MSFTDRTMICADCGGEFIFSAGEQAFYAERGFTNDPKRCPQCRQARRSDRGGSTRSFGSGGGRAMTRVTCDSCGKEAEVPFVPRGDRPVYCSDCYSSQRSQQHGGRG